jgi:hypothetical protein
MLMPERVGFSIADRNTATDWPCLLRESCADMNILTVLYLNNGMASPLAVSYLFHICSHRRQRD